MVQIAIGFGLGIRPLIALTNPAADWGEHSDLQCY